MSVPEELKSFFAIGIVALLLVIYFYEEESVPLFLVVLFIFGILYSLYASVKKYNIEKDKDVEFVQRLERDLLSSKDRIQTLKDYIKRLEYQESSVNVSASVSSDELSRRYDVRADYRRALKIVKNMLEKEIKIMKRQSE